MTNTADRKTVTKTLTIGYGVQAKRTTFSVIFALVITLIVNWEGIASILPQSQVPSLRLILSEQIPTYGQGEISNIIEQRRYVPNYDAFIYISSKSEEINIGGNVEFTIKIIDNGVIELQNPYFYLFLFNTQGEALSSFPNMGHLSTWYKMPAWNTLDHYSNFYTDCLQIESEGNSYYIPRKTLCDGYGEYVYEKTGNLHWFGDPSEIVFQFSIKNDPTLIGEWQLSVFLYDENYVDRFNNILDSDNFVNFQNMMFDVTSKTEPSLPSTFDELFRPIVSLTTFIITFTLTYFGIYSRIERNREKLQRVWIMIRKNIGFIASIVTILLVFVVYIVWF